MHTSRSISDLPHFIQWSLKQLDDLREKSGQPDAKEMFYMCRLLLVASQQQTMIMEYRTQELLNNNNLEPVVVKQGGMAEGDAGRSTTALAVTTAHHDPFTEQRNLLKRLIATDVSVKKHKPNDDDDDGKVKHKPAPALRDTTPVAHESPPTQTPLPNPFTQPPIMSQDFNAFPETQVMETQRFEEPIFDTQRFEEPIFGDHGYGDGQPQPTAEGRVRALHHD